MWRLRPAIYGSAVKQYLLNRGYSSKRDLEIVGETRGVINRSELNSLIIIIIIIIIL